MLHVSLSSLPLLFPQPQFITNNVPANTILLPEMANKCTKRAKHCSAINQALLKAGTFDFLPGIQLANEREEHSQACLPSTTAYQHLACRGCCREAGPCMREAAARRSHGKGKLLTLRRAAQLVRRAELVCKLVASGTCGRHRGHEGAGLA